MAFPKSVPTAWVVKSLATEGTKVSDLLPLQFGIFDEDTNLALAPSDVRKKRKVYFSLGSPNQKQFNQGAKVENNTNLNNADVNFRSEPVSTRLVDIIRSQDPKRVEKPNIYYLGYNGIDICKSLSFQCGKTYTFDVYLKGRPVRSIMGREIRELIQVTTDGCNDCFDTACTDSVGCEKYIDELVNNFNDYNRWTSRFFTAEKVIHCSPALPSLTTTSFTSYTLTVCDSGNELDLAAVQNQYPTLKVTVISRKAPYTTYGVTKTAGVPSAFTQASVVLQDCSVCPSGFTATAAGYAYVVDADNALLTAAAGGTTLLKLGTLSGVTAVSSSVVKADTDHTLYYLVTATPITAPSAGLSVSQTLGTVTARCTGPTTTTTWATGGTSYKVQRDLVITIKPDDCDALVLARMTAFYASYPEFVSGSLVFDVDSTDCLLRYTASQYNNDFLVDGCDTYAVAAFNPFPPFEGQQWVVDPCEGWTVDGTSGCPVPPTPTDRCCQCGIKFTGRPTTQLLDQFPGYDFNTYLEKDPIVMTINMTTLDESTDINDYGTVTWFQAQRATFRQLRGDDVIKEVIREEMYNKVPWVNQVNKTNQLFLLREGVKLGVNVDDFYYAVDIYHNVDYNTNNTASSNRLREQVRLFVNEKDLATLDALKALVTESFPDAKAENFV